MSWKFITMDRRRIRSDRGLALIHVGIAIFVLVAMSAFVLDFGVMWLARRQAQNAADAGALSGAIARLYDETADPPAADGLAYQSAVAAATANEVMNEAGGVRVTWECPEYVDEDSRCVRVDVHRDGTDVDGDATVDSTALPVFFANLFGLSSQRVRATATAWVGIGNATDCIKPFAIPDWYTPGEGVDSYVRPGYTLDDANNDEPVMIYGGPMAGFESPGWFRITDVIGGGAGGTSDTRAAIKSCAADRTEVGDTLQQGGVEAGIFSAVKDLFELDENARWEDGKVVNSCADTHTCMKYVRTGQEQFELVEDSNRSYSPRVMAIPVFDPEIYVNEGRIEVVNVLGFFLVEPLPKAPNFEIWGYITEIPALSISGGGSVPVNAAFLKVVQLIR